MNSTQKNNETVVETAKTNNSVNTDSIMKSNSGSGGVSGETRAEKERIIGATMEADLTLESLSDNLWSMPMSPDDISTCIDLGMIPANGLSNHIKGFSIALSCKCPDDLVHSVFKDGAFRIVVNAGFDPMPQKIAHERVDLNSTEDLTYLAVRPYLGTYKGDISLDKWVMIEQRINNTWMPTNCMNLAYQRKLKDAEDSLSQSSKNFHAALVAKERAITQLHRELSTATERHALEKSLLLQAQNLTQEYNLFLIQGVERLTENDLFFKNVSLTDDLEKASFERDLAIEEKVNAERLVEDLQRQLQYCERLLRKTTSTNHDPALRAA